VEHARCAISAVGCGLSCGCGCNQPVAVMFGAFPVTSEFRWDPITLSRFFGIAGHAAEPVIGRVGPLLFAGRRGRRDQFARALRRSSPWCNKLDACSDIAAHRHGHAIRVARFRFEFFRGVPQSLVEIPPCPKFPPGRSVPCSCPSARCRYDARPSR